MNSCIKVGRVLRKFLVSTANILYICRGFVGDKYANIAISKPANHITLYLIMKRIFTLFSFLVFTTAIWAQLPALTLKNIAGKDVAMSSLIEEGKPVVISFFATWCKPCLRELNAIHEVYDEWQEETGVRLVAVSIDEGANSLKVKPLVQANDWAYEVLLDPNSDLKRALQVTLIPTIIVLNGKGEITYRHTGYTEGGERQILEQIRKAQTP